MKWFPHFTFVLFSILIILNNSPKKVFQDAERFLLITQWNTHNHIFFLYIADLNLWNSAFITGIILGWLWELEADHSECSQQFRIWYTWNSNQFYEENELPHDKTNKVAFVPSKDSDQLGHPQSLIRVFAVCVKKHWVLSYPLSAQCRLWSDWADAQADLSLRWARVILLVLSWGGSNMFYSKKFQMIH